MPVENMNERIAIALERIAAALDRAAPRVHEEDEVDQANAALDRVRALAEDLRRESWNMPRRHSQYIGNLILRAIVGTHPVFTDKFTSHDEAKSEDKPTKGPIGSTGYAGGDSL